MPSDDLYALYQNANSYLNEGLIRHGAPPASKARTRRQWMQWFLPYLDHPEQAFPAIHVAGTSGKGSVAVMVAEILRAAGWRSGCHVSPYLQVATEKHWVDGKYASAEQYHELVQWVRPRAEPCRGADVPLHGMASVGVALEHFRRQQVEVGVVEAGVGGRCDLTNVLQTQVAVITSVGLDHLKTLGPTLKDIAWHKAGIIHAGCSAVVLEGAGVPAAQKQAQQVGAPLRVVSREDFRAEPLTAGQVALHYQGPRFHLQGAPVGMWGRFQGENAAMAVAAVEAWDPQGQRVDETAVRQGLRRARLPGRMELIPAKITGACPVLLDGAHNPDKLAAMLASLPGGPAAADPLTPVHIVYGSLASRAPDEAVTQLARRAATFTVTEPQVYGKAPRPAQDVCQLLRQGAGSDAEAVPDPLEATQQALARAQPGHLVLVTGSLYLCGQVRDIWFPQEAVLRQRTSWPSG